MEAALYVTVATHRGPTDLSGLVGLLAGGLAVRSTLVPSQHHTWFNLALLAAVAGLAILGGYTRDELGLEPQRLGDGLRWGACAAGIVVAIVVVAAALPPFAGAFDDDRVKIGLPTMLLRALVVIPVATVVLEELAFRGLLLAALCRRVDVRAGVVWSSVAFGLWHVPGAWSSADDNATLGEVATSSQGRLAVVVATVIVTTVVGLVFAWLRIRSRSLVAPVMLHTATNVTPFVAAWVLAR